MASLNPSLAILKRARKDLANLKDAVGNLERGEYLDLMVGQPKPRGGFHYDLPNPLTDLAADVGVISGQIRAALDQLVYSLFELRNGRPPPAKRRTQFPICEKPEDFRSRVKPDLEGLNVADIALIEAAQPYNGRQWLGELKLLAEEHKHRKLVFISTGRTQMTAYTADTAESNYFALPISGVRAPKTMHVNTKISGPISLSDGTPVIDKLQILEAEVANVVDAFKPLFD